MPNFARIEKNENAFIGATKVREETCHTIEFVNINVNVNVVVVVIFGESVLFGRGMIYRRASLP